MFDQLIQTAEQSMRGEVLALPYRLDRIGSILSLRKNIYTLIAGGTGSGKTSFVDNVYVLKAIEDCFNSGIKIKILYKSMERSKQDKIAKFTSYYIFRKYGYVLSSNRITGKELPLIKAEELELVREARPWVEQILSYVDIRDGACRPSELKAWVDEHALKHGYLYESNNTTILCNKNVVCNFTEKDYIKDQAGTFVLQKTIKHVDGSTFTIKPNEKRYFDADPKRITLVIADHIGKFRSKGSESKKDVIDEASFDASTFRDLYGYSPIYVTQLNRQVANSLRVQQSKGDLAPIIEDIKDSGNSVEDLMKLIYLIY